MSQIDCTRPFTDAASSRYGLPEERHARIAARRAFVEMKLCFMRAAADIEGAIGESLQFRVRQASEAVELWRLRSAILADLPEQHERTRTHRFELHRQLDSIYPETAVSSLYSHL